MLLWLVLGVFGFGVVAAWSGVIGVSHRNVRFFCEET